MARSFLLQAKLIKLFAEKLSNSPTKNERWSSFRPFFRRDDPGHGHGHGHGHPVPAPQLVSSSSRQSASSSSQCSSAGPNHEQVTKQITRSHFSGVADPDPEPSDPYVFGPPGSISQGYGSGSGSGSFYHQAKMVRKTLIPMFCDFFMTFYLWKMMLMYLQKVLSRRTFY